MRRNHTVLVMLALALAGCGSSAQPGGASVAATASSSASAQASNEAAQSATAAPQPTLVSTSGPATSPEGSPAAAAPSVQPGTAGSGAASAQPSAAAASAANAAPPFARTLQLAEPRLQGDDVRLVQQRLAELGYAQVGAADGIFGPMTDTAVRAFQQINQLEADGIVGPRSWELLFGSAIGVSTIVPVVSLPTGWLLGSSSGGRWLDVGPSAALLRGGEPYRIPGSQTAYSGGVPSTPEVPCETAYAVQLSPPPPDDFDVAVGGSFELQPRPVSEEDPAQEAYRSQVAAFLTAQGIAEPVVQIQQALGVDLDGDGSREVVLSATRLGAAEGILPVTPSVEAGDYSVVMVLREGQAAPLILDSNVFSQAEDFSAPQRFLVVGVYDLNGDGGMEVVVDGAYYEGVFISVYEVRASGQQFVLGNGCGV